VSKMAVSDVFDSIRNFPLPTLREKQAHVLKEIDAALGSGHQHIILEAPTGSGKSAVSIAVALTLGSSYICTATKDLQSQYKRDFPFVKIAKGRANFLCDVNAADKCECLGECYHNTAKFGPCLNQDYFCDFKPHPADYIVTKRGTKRETIEYSPGSSRGLPMYPQEGRCEYFNQLYIASAAGHSIFNYPMFLGLLSAGDKILRPRELLILDEAHLLESRIVEFKSITISKRKWSRYVPGLHIENFGNDIEGWINFLSNLNGMVKDRIKTIKRVHSQNEQEDQRKLEYAIAEIKSSDNWVVSDIVQDFKEVIKVQFKPLSVADDCKRVFEKGKHALLTSATILSPKIFCDSLGLDEGGVKVIRVGSDFPKENRPIYPLNIGNLNYFNLQQDRCQTAIAEVVDFLMTHHSTHKGIIHTQSYRNLEFIKKGLSAVNYRRLIETNSETERDDVINKHMSSNEPTVLISPSLGLGISLNDSLSRWQIIVKVPYPDLKNRYINAKKERLGQDWYDFQTALKLVQSYGRSVRSKEDWAFTYVLDSQFGVFVDKHRDMLPGWFLEAITSLVGEG
jgi:ATP-dependent DNA helicase DinG